MGMGICFKLIIGDWCEAMFARFPFTNMEAAFGRLHNSGAGAFGARPTVVESIMVDGEIDGSIYGTIYPAIYGSQNGAVNNNPSGRIIKICGRIIEQLVIYMYINGFSSNHSFQKSQDPRTRPGPRVPGTQVLGPRPRVPRNF